MPLMLLASSSAAFGQQDQTLNRTVRSGVSTELAHHTSWDDHTCETNGGTVQLLTKPQHGKVTPTTARRMFHRAINGATRCTGGARLYQAFVIYYKSNPGYRGTDTFSIQIHLGNGRIWSEYFNVSVE